MIFILGSCKKDNPHPISTDTTSRFTLSNVLQSNMVVQRGKPVQIWGTARTNSIITLNASWNSGTLTATANAAGKWKINIPAAAANASPQTIIIKKDGANTITLRNILIGDVWICSGQSNMVMQLDSNSGFRGVINYPAEIAAANYPQIRVMTLQSDFEYSLQDTLNNPQKWLVCTPQTAEGMSAVAYYFARKLTTSLNVPIGIVVSAVSGTSCEAWISNAALEADNYLYDKYQGNNSSSMLYNGMINPLINLSIQGFTWYQGENNRENSPVSDYTKLNSALIQNWRAAFNQGSLPFYYVQLPGFAQDYYTTSPHGGDTTLDDYAKFREAQAGVLAVSNTGMAITIDVGEPANIHPRDKMPVGERLALLALKNTYGQNVQSAGPKYASFSVSGNVATINFVTGTANGLNTINNAPLKQYFYVAGSNHVFYRAAAIISGNKMLLTAPAGMLGAIQAVRYAFTNAPVTNLQNSTGLPMEPFRTDTWDN